MKLLEPFCEPLNRNTHYLEHAKLRKESILRRLDCVHVVDHADKRLLCTLALTIDNPRKCRMCGPAA